MCARFRTRSATLGTNRYLARQVSTSAQVLAIEVLSRYLDRLPGDTCQTASYPICFRLQCTLHSTAYTPREFPSSLGRLVDSLHPTHTKLDRIHTVPSCFPLSSCQTVLLRGTGGSPRHHSM